MTRKFKVGLISKTFYYTPVWAAIEQKFFEAEGLELDLSFIGSDAQCERLLAGTLDIAIAPPEGIVQNVEAGGTLRLVAGNSGQLSHFLMAQPDIKTIEDLHCRLFGILSKTEGSFFHFQEAAEAHGLFYPDDYRVIETGGAPARHQALQDKSIDAGLQSVPWCYLAEDLGFNKLCDISDYVPDWQFNTINVELKHANAARAEVEGFLRALLRGVEWVYANADASAAIAAEHMQIEPKYARRAWDYFTGNGKLTRNMQINYPGLTKTIQAQIKAGLLKAGADQALERYVDDSFLKDVAITPSGLG